jgi:FkbM family methyltransferase
VSYLKELIRRNQFTDCQIFPVALASEDGSAVLNLHYDDPTDRTASLQESEMAVLNQLKVETISFETVLKNIEFESSDIACIKIDSEGSELIILKAMVPLIRRYRPVIIVEVLDTTQDGGFRLREINRIILDSAYRIFRVVKKDMKLASLLPMERISSPYGVEESDFVLIPAEAKKKVHLGGAP